MNNKAQYCSVVRTGFGKTTICMGGEVDASKHRPLCRSPGWEGNAALLTHACPLVWDSKPVQQGAPINWVELKTSAEIRSDRDWEAFERKLLKFWSQSFLLGVPRIIVGFRSREGMLLRLETFETANIPTAVTKPSHRGPWDGNVCINFTSGFLECGLLSPLPPLRTPRSISPSTPTLRWQWLVANVRLSRAHEHHLRRGSLEDTEAAGLADARGVQSGRDVTRKGGDGLDHQLAHQALSGYQQFKSAECDVQGYDSGCAWLGLLLVTFVESRYYYTGPNRFFLILCHEIQCTIH